MAVFEFLDKVANNTGCAKECKSFIERYQALKELCEIIEDINT
jgi:hypothetical protein